MSFRDVKVQILKKVQTNLFKTRKKTVIFFLNSVILYRIKQNSGGSYFWIINFCNEFRKKRGGKNWKYWNSIIERKKWNKRGIGKKTKKRIIGRIKRRKPENRRRRRKKRWLR